MKEVSAAEFHDPEFGTLTAEGDLWKGSVTSDDVSIPFTVAGTVTAPDSGLLDCVREIVRRFHDVEREGLAFLRAQIAEARGSSLAFYALEFLWEDKPGIYALEWIADGDDVCVWRVNYEDGKPTEAGFDD